jgi:hypothetical protein
VDAPTAVRLVGLRATPVFSTAMPLVALGIALLAAFAAALRP